MYSEKNLCPRRGEVRGTITVADGKIIAVKKKDIKDKDAVDYGSLCIIQVSLIYT